MRTLLVIDDEQPIRRAVAHALRDNAERVLQAANGNDGISMAAAERPALIILDLGLPDLDGADVCREIRRWATMPIIVLSVRQSDREKARLLDAGADDFITKPFSLTELAARVRAQLRRIILGAPIQSTLVRMDGLTIDLAGRRVTRADEIIRLTPTEWDILCALVMQAGRILTHRQLFNAVWQRSPGNAQQYLRVHITNLRRKIEKDPANPRVILTEPGVGYRAGLEA